MYTLILLAVLAQDLVVDVNLRTIDVSVEDESGRPVLDLTADDFEVLESGRIAPVKHLSLETGPLAVGLLLDRSSSIYPVKRELDEAILRVSENLRPDDEAFLMTFAGTDKLAVRLSTAHKDLPTAVRRAKFGFGSRFYDSIIDSLRYLSTSALPRRLLIVFSDGADHYSKHTFEQVIGSAEFHQAPIYVVSYTGDDSRTWSGRGRREIRDQFEHLAGITGGQVFFPATSVDCAAIAGRIFERARYQYRLGFYSSDSQTKPADVQIRLRDGSRHLIVRSSRPLDFL